MFKSLKYLPCLIHLSLVKSRIYASSIATVEDSVETAESIDNSLLLLLPNTRAHRRAHTSGSRLEYSGQHTDSVVVTVVVTVVAVVSVETVVEGVLPQVSSSSVICPV